VLDAWICGDGRFVEGIPGSLGRSSMVAGAAFSLHGGRQRIDECSMPREQMRDAKWCVDGLVGGIVGVVLLLLQARPSSLVVWYMAWFCRLAAMYTVRNFGRGQKASSVSVIYCVFCNAWRDVRGGSCACYNFTSGTRRTKKYHSTVGSGSHARCRKQDRRVGTCQGYETDCPFDDNKEREGDTDRQSAVGCPHARDTATLPQTTSVNTSMLSSRVECST
jgi:hypothetical protein